MSSPARVTIHPSQFPEAVRRDLLESLRSRRVNHKFHYDNVKQTKKWLALHQAYSPSRNDADCAATYDASFAGAVQRIDAKTVHVIGLGCGGGQKDARLLRLLKNSEREVSYTPSDVSAAMVLVAREAALEIIPDAHCHPLVCDLATADDLASVLDVASKPGETRLITFFGMIPNFEPAMILPRLASLLRDGDYLLFSANLAPGPDYTAGLKRVLPQYDNPLTREWLMTFLLDLGVENGDGELRFAVENDPAGIGLKRIEANFHFNRARPIKVEGESFDFKPGDSISLFFSYRHTPESVKTLLGEHGVQVLDQWITKAVEEGVFLCQRKQ